MSHDHWKSFGIEEIKCPGPERERDAEGGSESDQCSRQPVKQKAKVKILHEYRNPKLTMKTTILCTLMMGATVLVASAQNANITWQSPVTISGTSDVSTSGTLVGTWGPGDDWGGTSRSDYYPVNGVTFAAYGSGPFGSWVSTSGLDDRYGSYANPNTADANYNYVLQTAIYSYGEPISLTWGGMTAGDTYQLEFWVNDGRNNITAERTETLTGGSNTSAPLAYGTGPNGTGPGQYILGTFVADNTGSETLTLTPFGGADIGASAQVNLLQLRDITAVPEPATVAFVAMGVGLFLFGIRREKVSA